jgi:hypothetical protein
MSVPPSSIVSGRVLHLAGYKYAVAAAAPGAGAGMTRPKHGIAHGAVSATRVCTMGVPTGATPCGCAAGITSSSSKRNCSAACVSVAATATGTHTCSSALPQLIVFLRAAENIYVHLHLQKNKTWCRL